MRVRSERKERKKPSTERPRLPNAKSRSFDHRVEYYRVNGSPIVTVEVLGDSSNNLHRPPPSEGIQEGGCRRLGRLVGGQGAG